MTAPDRIGLISNGLGQWALATRDEADIAVHYLRRDPAALAGDETVQAMIGAVVEEAANKLLDLVVERRSMRKFAGNDYIAACARKVAALRPDAAAAFARARQAERVKALEEVAKMAEEGRLSLVSDHCAAQIRALKEAQP